MAELIQFANGVPGIRFTLDKPQLRIGRSTRENDICVPDEYVSKAHALIEMKKNKDSDEGCAYFLCDLGSTNHTYVNKEKIARTQLFNNDIVYVGKNMFRFVCEEHEMRKGVEQETSETLEFDTDESQYNITFSRRLRVLGA